MVAEAPDATIDGPQHVSQCVRRRRSRWCGRHVVRARRRAGDWTTQVLSDDHNRYDAAAASEFAGWEGDTDVLWAAPLRPQRRASGGGPSDSRLAGSGSPLAFHSACTQQWFAEGAPRRPGRTNRPDRPVEPPRRARPVVAMRSTPTVSVAMATRPAMNGGELRQSRPGAASVQSARSFRASPTSLKRRQQPHPAFVGGRVWPELGADRRRHRLEHVTAPLASGCSLVDGRTASYPVEADELRPHLLRGTPQTRRTQQIARI